MTKVSKLPFCRSWRLMALKDGRRVRVGCSLRCEPGAGHAGAHVGWLEGERVTW